MVINYVQYDRETVNKSHFISGSLRKTFVIKNGETQYNTFNINCQVEFYIIGKKTTLNSIVLWFSTSLII